MHVGYVLAICVLLSALLATQSAAPTCAGPVCPVGGWGSLAVSQACPPWSYTYAPYAASIDDCTCVPGSFSLTGHASAVANCTPCSPGFFAAFANSTRCDPCPGGTFAAPNGTTTNGSLASGGAVTYDVPGYFVHSFTTSGNITFTQDTYVDVLVGGGGGGGGLNVGGGGGAGAIIFYTQYRFAAGTYQVTVAGTSAPGASGGNSAISQGSTLIFSAVGGGNGGGFTAPNSPSVGGSGGGARDTQTGGSVTVTGAAFASTNVVAMLSGQSPANSVYVKGNAGGTTATTVSIWCNNPPTACGSAGGGGAGASPGTKTSANCLAQQGGAGINGMNGYLFSSAFGAAYNNTAQLSGGGYYIAGGGAGAGHVCTGTIAGGIGGGGIGSYEDVTAGGAGAPNTCSGGGGGAANGGTGGMGSTGLVLMRYAASQPWAAGLPSGAASGCSLCAPNTFSTVGSTACTACPTGSTAAAGSTACTSAAGYYDLGKSLVAYYTFDAANMTADSAPVPLGALTASKTPPTAGTGPWAGANAAYFSQIGSTGYSSDFAAGQSFMLPNITSNYTNFTACMWIAPTSSAGSGGSPGRVLDMTWSYALGRFAIFTANSGELYFGYPAAVGKSCMRNDRFAYASSTWVHVCAVVQDSAMLRWCGNADCNPGYVPSGWSTSIVTDSSNPYNYLARGSVTYGSTSTLWAGRMDEVRLYPRALSQVEVTTIYSYRGNMTTSVMPILCPVGTFSGSSNAAACASCPPGFYSGVGATVCTGCIAGSFSGINGSGSCVSCGSGSFSADNASVCVSCAANTFSSVAGAAACANCPVGSSSLVGSTACTANAGYYDLGKSLMAYYAFDAPSITADSAPNPLGALTATSTDPTSVVGQWNGSSAASFNNRPLAIPTLFWPISGALSVCAWYRPEAIWGSLFNLGSGPGRNSLEINWSSYGDGTGLWVKWNDYTAGANSNTYYNAYILGVWRHVCVVSYNNNNSGAVFLNGVSNGAYVGGVGAQGIITGNSMGGLLGAMDEARLYSRALTADEVTAIYSYSGNMTTAVMPILCPAGSFSCTGSSACASCPTGSFSAAGASACTVNAGYYDMGRSLMAYYTFDSANYLADSAPVPLGPLVASATPPTVTAGMWAGSSAANLTQGYFALPNITLTSPSFSVCAWILPTRVISNWEGIFEIAQANGQNTVVVLAQNPSSPQLEAATSQSGTIYTYQYYLSSWLHFCFVVSSASQLTTLYSNSGTQSAVSQALGSDIPTGITRNANYIGQRYSKPPWYGGSIDEVRLYPLALTQAEVTAIYSYRGTMTTAVMPVLCPAGTFSGTFNATACASCPPGFYSGVGATMCTGCSAGLFSGTTGSSTCTSCSGGSFSAANASGCGICSAGAYSNTGASGCVQCAANTFSVAASSACASCPVGSLAAVAGASACTANAGYYDLGKSLLAYYTFDAVNMTVDSAPVPLGSLTAIGGVTPTVTVGKWPGSSAANFAQVNATGYDDFTNSQSYQMPNVPASAGVSMCAWFLPANDTAANTILELGTGCWRSTIGVYFGSGGTSALLSAVIMNSDTGWLATPTIYNAFVQRQWTHMCGVVYGTSFILYINGQANGFGLASSLPIVTRTAAYIGRSTCSDKNLFKGDMDEVRLYPRALTQAEVTAIYGYRGNMTTAVMPVLCPAGTYSDTAGASSCSTCPAGSYSATAGASVCVFCPAGYYTMSTATGATSAPTCSSCPAGSYSYGSRGPMRWLTDTPTAPPNPGIALMGTFTLDLYWELTFQLMPLQSSAAGNGRLLAIQGVDMSDLFVANSQFPGIATWFRTSTRWFQVTPSTYVVPVGTWTDIKIRVVQNTIWTFANESGTAGIGFSEGANLAFNGRVVLGASSPVPAAALIRNLVYTSAPPSVCTLCGVGTYSAALTATSISVCQGCPAGTYANGLGIAVCTTCSAGSYAGANATSCIPVNCPAGSYGVVGGTSASSECQPCPNNTFSGAASIACAICPVGSFSVGGASACTANAGYYDLGRSLLAYYTFDAANMTADSAPRPLGALSASTTAPTVGTGPWAGAAAATFPSDNFTGTVSYRSFYIPTFTLDLSFSICAWYMPAEQGYWSSLVFLGPGSIVRVQERLSTSNLQVTYYKPPQVQLIGYTYGSSTFVNNLWSHFCLVKANSTFATMYLNAAPSTHPFGGNMDPFVSAVGDNQLGAAFVGVMDEVRLYPRALTQPEVTAIFGYRGNMTTSVMPVLCPAGTFSAMSNATVCASCPVGFYSGIGAVVCMGCSAGSFTNATGSSSCSNCSGGAFSAGNASVCSMCSAGAYSNTGSGACSPCAANTFSVSGSSACAGCPLGSFSAGGATACTTNAGYYDLGKSLMAYYTFDAANMTADSAPSPLGALTASATPPTPTSGMWAGSSASNFALANSSGNATGLSGDLVYGQSFQLPSFTVNTSFSICLWFMPTVPTSARFIDFSKGYNQEFILLGPVSAADSRLASYFMGGGGGSGTYSNYGSYAVSSWGHVCGVQESLTAASVYASGVRKQFGPFNALASGITRTQNYIGRTTPDGVGLLSPLFLGAMDEVRMYSRALTQAEVTAIYSYRGNMTTSVMPVLCPAGTFSNASGAPICASCPLGFYSGDGATVCVGCSAGRFSNVTGSSDCPSCNGGFFSAANASTCGMCSAGNYSAIGASACSMCAANTFSVAGSSACASCPVGSSSAAGATACTVNAGYYDLGKSLLAYYTFDAANFLGDSAPKPLGPLSATAASPTVSTGAWAGVSAANFSQKDSAGLAADTFFALPTVSSSSTGFSVCLWYMPTVDPTTHSWDAMVSLFNVKIIIGQRTTINSVQVWWIGNGNSNYITATVYPGTYYMNQWWHVCTVGDGTYQGFSAYFNGNWQALPYYGGTGNIITSGGASYLGYTSGYGGVQRGNPLFQGVLDEVRLYPRALTQAEVTSVSSYRGNMTTAVMPVLCPAGTFSNASGATVCASCPLGFYSGAGATVCVGCGAGLFSNVTGSSGCVSCSGGFFSAANASTCGMCSAGNYSATGASACSVCAANTYSVTASSACASCPGGSFSFGGATACTVNAGYYDLGRSLMAYYTFDAASMTADSAPVPLGALTASATQPTLTSGMWAGSSAASFALANSSGNATGLSGDLAYGESFQLPSFTIDTSFSVCVWIMPMTNNGAIRFVDFATGYNVNSIIVQESNTGLSSVNAYFFAGTTILGSYAVSNTFVLSTWRHVCAVVTDKSANLYTQGIGISNPFSLPGTITPGTTRTQNLVGRSAYANEPSFMGTMDELRLYPRALTQAEVTAIYTYRGNMTTAVMPVLCPAGTFSGAPNATACASCLSGFYSGTGAPVCIGCSVSSYCADGLSRACPAGSFTVQANASACSTCANGTYSLGTNTSVCLACAPGAWCVNGLSYACTAGSFAAGNASACAACAPGTIAATSSASICVACAGGTTTYAGYGGSSVLCVACPAGTYNGSLGNSCTNCSGGSFSAAGASRCTLCAGGYWSSSGAPTCTECPYGSYCPAGASAPLQCRACSDNATQTQPCRSMSSNDTTDCRCNGGYRGDGRACTLCEADRWCVAGSLFRCPDYSHSPNGSSSIDHCKCNGGYYADGPINGTSPCALCWSGYYCLGSDLGSQSCPSNSTSSQGAVEQRQCVCNSGFYNNASRPDVNVTCAVCLPDAICKGGNMTMCPDNSSPQAVGLNGEPDCSCDAGYYGYPWACEMCPQNFYCTGGTAFSGCTTHAVTAGRRTVDAYLCFCDAGYAGRNNTMCVECEAGTFCYQGLRNTCPNNTLSQRLAWDVSNCTCNAGYSGANGGPECGSCDPGTYAMRTGLSACDGCAAGSYSDSIGRTTPCTNCSVGTYSNLTRQTSVQTCESCMAGTYSRSVGVSRCLVCAVGTYNEYPGCTACAFCPRHTQGASNVSTGSVLQCRCSGGFNCAYTRKAYMRVQAVYDTKSVTDIGSVVRQTLLSIMSTTISDNVAVDVIEV